jgi:hypothetical protein
MSREAIMEQRVSLITLGVADVDESRRFYERLGWRASRASVPGVVTFFQAGGMALALWGRNELAADARMADDGAPRFGRVALAQNVRRREDVAAVLAEAEAAGGRLQRPDADTDWGGRVGYFTDPDGHLWEVAWNPHFTLAPDGALKLPE